MNILLAGVGGQGTVLASKLLAQCGMDKGQNARTAETIGMAQRGGCVVSHVRIGDHMYSPLIPKGEADLIIGFEPAEAVRCLDYLKPGGKIVVSKRAIKPTTDALSGASYDAAEMIEFLISTVKDTVVVDGEKICLESGSTRSLNIALLGAAAGCGALGFDENDLKASILKLIPKHVDANLKALRLGMESVIK